MTNTIKQIQKCVGVTVDGDFGNKTLAAVAQRLGCAESVRVVQHVVGADVDGVVGKETASKIAVALGLFVWPSQAEVRSEKSIFGKPGRETNLVNIEPPYQLYYEGRPVKSIRVHKLIAKAVLTALEKIKAAYSSAEISRLGLDDYGGSYNYRLSKGGNSFSMHAWGIALDFAPSKNALKTKAPHASLSKPECRAFWEAWESVGAVSLGREKNYDWMHVQFATL